MPINALQEIYTNSLSIMFAKEEVGHDASTEEKKLALTNVALVNDILERIDLADERLKTTITTNLCQFNYNFNFII